MRRPALVAALVLSVATVAAAQQQPPATVGPPLPLASFRYHRAIAPGDGQLVAVPLDANVLAHSAFTRSGAFSDLRVLDGQGRQVPYVIERLTDPLRVAVALAPATSASARPRESVYDMAMPAARLPPATLVLHTTARVFRRELRVEAIRPADARHRDEWVDTLATVSWVHDAPDTAAPPASLALSDLTGARLRTRLVVLEGDNAPLVITRAELLLPAFRVRFYPPAATSLTLAYGNPTLRAPEYDLALLGATVLGTGAAEISAGPEQDVAPAGTAPIIPPAAFWTVLVVAALALAWLVVSLVRRRDD